ncbi:hypothetical protein MAP00_006071 [Monascus purpureus]|nr:hypothetical protein MAP00_006071 [Monascus purpureus]
MIIQDIQCSTQMAPAQSYLSITSSVPLHPFGSICSRISGILKETSIMRLFRALGAAVSLACAANAVSEPILHDKRSFVERDGVNYTVFEHAATGARLEFVKNSGICETTPGVNQYSGYLSVGTNMNMWFWFFESRSNPSTDPLVAWFNGGPGCSSMIGLFQENGPCRFVNNETTPSLNPYSFNEVANVVYIDQPIGVGFSYGTDTVTSTDSAAPYVWKLLQAFFTRFPEYESREFAIFTESYGGHYGPEFAHYIQQQNEGIKRGLVKGEEINLVALGINNGWFDSGIQEKAYADFAYNNNYRRLINESQYESFLAAYYTKCLPAVQLCNLLRTNEACENADNICGSNIDNPISEAADFDVYDVRSPAEDPNPPSTYSSYLQQEGVVKAIGARVQYQECPDAPYDKFSKTGDNSRTFLPTLSQVVRTGIQVLIWAGDADWICNWLGVQDVVNAVAFPGTLEFRRKPLVPYTVGGEAKGTFKAVDNLSFLRVFEAGHEVPFYRTF